MIILPPLLKLFASRSSAPASHAARRRPSIVYVPPPNPDGLSPLLLSAVGSYSDAGSPRAYADRLRRELDHQIDARQARVDAMNIRLGRLDADAAQIERKLQDVQNARDRLERALRQGAGGWPVTIGGRSFDPVSGQAALHRLDQALADARKYRAERTSAAEKMRQILAGAGKDLDALRAMRPQITSSSSAESEADVRAFARRLSPYADSLSALSDASVGLALDPAATTPPDLDSILNERKK